MARWINRAVLIVRPRKPFLDWAASTDDEAPEHVKELEKNVSVYLVGKDPNEKEETAPLERYFKRIFEAELEGWWTNRADWPKKRTLQTFLGWFDVTGESVVTDLEPGPIEHEDL
jgi:hypothetical protein